MDSVKAGDVVFVDFTGRLARDNSLFATTIKAEAEKAGLDAGHERDYKPMMLVAGKGQTVKGLDDAIVGAEVGKKNTVKVAADQAFGQRDSAKVRIIPIGEFRKREIQPYPGMPLELDGGMRGTVKSVEAGRIKVDFNEPLAGEDLEYEFTVTRCASKPEDKLSFLLSGMTGLDSVSFDPATGVARVNVAANVRKDSEYVMNKVGFVSMALQYVEGCRKVVFEEEYAVESEKPAEA